MRKILFTFLALVLLMSFTACASTVGDRAVDGENGGTTQPVKTMSAEELEAAISQQEVRVRSTKYCVQDEEYKSLYPDLLQAVIVNDSSYDIKNAVVAFVAWDVNNLPVKIEGQHDFGSTSYIKQCNFNDINLIPGKSYGKDSGLALDKDCNTIKYMKAIVVSYETFDGETWDNPLYENWVALYEGKRYN